jgi:hypothetical protein
LDPEKRAFANLYGKGREYSVVLRKGLCQTLILFSLFEHILSTKLGYNPKQISTNLIGDLLNTVDPQLWMSIHDQMQLIAEAAPKVFLESLETQLNTPETPIAKLFNEERGFLFPQSYLPGMLWAIESLAWFPEYFPQSCLLLARLAEMDPGGSTSNRPINSLKEIFKPWHPGTYSSVQERMEVLSLISDQYPEAAWNLLVSLLPSGFGHDFSMGTSKSKWLHLLISPNTYEIEPAKSEYYNYVFELLLKLSANDSQKIAELIRMSQAFPIKVRDRILSEATSMATVINDPNHLIWNELRSIIHDNTAHPDAKWALPIPELQKYIDLRKIFDQRSNINSGIWLFNDPWPKLPEGFPSEVDTHEKQDEYIKELQTEFVSKIHLEKGIEGLLSYNELLTNKYSFAYAISKLDLTAEDLKQLLLNYKRSAQTKELIKRFVYSFTFRNSSEIILNHQGDLLSDGIDISSLIEIYISMKQSKELWTHINTLGPEASKSFWSLIEPHFGIYSDSEIIYASERLLEYGRPFTVLSEITHHLPIVPTSILHRILSACSQGPSDESPFMNEYSLRSAFEELQSRSDIVPEDVVVLEWQFLPLLMRSGRDQIDLLMKTQLSRDPVFFNTIMEVLYDQDSKSKLSPIQLENHFRFLIACDEVLNSIKTLPGQKTDFSIDKESFKNWLDTVRQDAVDKNRVEKVDFRIGRMFGNFSLENHASSGFVYEYIQAIKSKSLSDGFFSGIVSTGKSTWRSIDAGGNLEWKKRDDALSKARSLRTTYPYVASIYSEIADYYKEKAEREDREALYHKLDDE